MSLSPGTKLGPYEIAARIGAGGMSEVYRAFDPRIRRDVAVKVLPPTYAKYADRMHRFEQEARAIGALNHPNLLTIFDVGSADGKPYIVTELLEGQTLRSCMRHEGRPIRLPVRKAVDYAAQIATGLAAAHERGIVHRDLKPENLFVTRDGRVKILDFGVAKLRSTEEHALSDDTTMEQDTSPGTVIGTVGYMSPEQVRGQAVDGRSDIFSLGTVMYEMLAGEHPFRSTSPADTMSAILREDPGDLTSINNSVPPGLDRIVRHCLEKPVEMRFQSARDLAFDLDSLTSSSGTAPAFAAPSPLNTRIGKFIALSLALLAIGALAGWLMRARFDSSHRVHPRFSQLTFDEGLELSPSLSPDGKTFVFVRGTGAAADIYLQRVDGRNAINLTRRCAAGDSQPAFSPDGSQIAYRSECDGGGIFVMGATGESARRVAENCFNPSWSPDGTQIVCATEGVGFTPTSRGTHSALVLVDVQNGTTRTLLPRDGVQPNWSPNGHRIAYWGIVGESAQRDLWTIDPRAKDPEKSIVRVTDDAAVDWNPLWSADGQHLYFVSDRNGAMSLWRTRINEESGKVRGEPEAITTPARFSGNYSLSRGTGRLAFSAIDQTEQMRAVPFDVASGANGEGRPIIGGSFLTFSSEVSPDGRLVAMTNRSGQEDLFVIEVATGEIRQLTNDAARDRGATWSPDGSRIYFYSQRESDRYEIWSIHADGGGLTRVTKTSGRGAWYPAVARDGKRLSFYNDENTYLLDLTRPVAQIEPLPPAPDGHHPAMTSWSPDGNMLAGELRNAPGIAIYALPTRSYRQITTSGSRPYWLPNGREILYVDGGRLRVADVVTGAIRDVATPAGASTMSLSADARTLVYSDRRTQADIWMME